MKKIVTIIFSKDRPLQLDLCIRSFLAHADWYNDIFVLYTCSNDRYQKSYDTLEKIWTNIKFVKQTSFKDNLLGIWDGYENVLFVVDDTVFVGDFYLSDCIVQLGKDLSLLGISLRLGKNTTYCYTMDQNQRVPQFENVRSLYGGMGKFNWLTAEADFGYPLELSSSIYRVEDLKYLFSVAKYENPNQLEWIMFLNSRGYQRRPFLGCYENSVAFSIPANRVQKENNNRIFGSSEYSPENLLTLFEKHYYVYLAIFNGFVPNSCHCEFDFLKDKNEKPTN